MNLIEMAKEQELFAQIEEELKLHRQGYFRSVEVPAKHIRKSVRDLSHKITNIRITHKKENQYIQKVYSRYAIISFDIRNRRFKSTWDNNEQKLILRSVTDIATS